MSKALMTFMCSMCNEELPMMHIFRTRINGGRIEHICKTCEGKSAPPKPHNKTREPELRYSIYDVDILNKMELGLK